MFPSDPATDGKPASSGWTISPVDGSGAAPSAAPMQAPTGGGRGGVGAPNATPASGWTMSEVPTAEDTNRPNGIWGVIKGIGDTVLPSFTQGANAIPSIKQAILNSSPLTYLASPIAQGMSDMAGKAWGQLKRIPTDVRSGHLGLAGGDLVSAGGYGAAAALPIIGPAAAKVGEDFGDGKFAYGSGETLGLTGPSLLGMGVDSTEGHLAGPLARNAENTYSKALRPTGLKARTMAGEVVTPEALKRGITATSTHDLLDKATTGRQAAGAEIGRQENAIVARQQGNPVAQQLTGGAAGRGYAILHPVQPVIDMLEDMRNGNGKTQGPTVVNGVVSNPIKDRAISAFQQTLKEMAASDEYAQGPPIGGRGTPVSGTVNVTNPGSVIPGANSGHIGGLSENAMLNFRRSLDEQIGNKHVTIPGTDQTAPVVVARALSNTLRDTFNSTHPDIAAAFQDYRFFKTMETLAKRSTVSKVGAQGLMSSMGGTAAIGTAGAAADFIHGGGSAGGSLAVGGGAAVAFKLLHEAAKSTAWRTLSGVAKYNLANAMASGQFHLVTSILSHAGLVAVQSSNQAAQTGQNQ